MNQFRKQIFNEGNFSSGCFAAKGKPDQRIGFSLWDPKSQHDVRWLE